MGFAARNSGRSVCVCMHARGGWGVAGVVVVGVQGEGVCGAGGGGGGAGGVAHDGVEGAR